MKRSNQNAASPPDVHAATPDDSEDPIKELSELIGQRRKLEAAADEIPAQVQAAEQELAALRGTLASKEASLVLIDEAKLKGLQKEIDAIAESINGKDLALRRLKNRLVALEGLAPDLDEKIDLAIGFVRVEANMAAQDMQASLAEELRGKVAEVRVIYAKVRALQRLVPMVRISDFLISAYVPDLESCMRVNTGTGHYDAAPNLLSLADEDTAAAEAAIAAEMKPITDALAIGRQHRRYVPISKRPQPYQYRGSNSGPALGLRGPIGEPGPPPRMIEEKPAFNGYKINAPYEIKGDMTGRRTREAMAEVNITAAMAFNPDR